MKAYPLIYSRTKFCDYVSGFLVRPHDLAYNAAARYVAIALNEIKYSDGLRHAVFSVGDYIIYGGTACMTPSIIYRIKEERHLHQLDLDYESYQSDQADRPIIFFAGFAVKRSDMTNGIIPDVDLYETYRIYLRYLEKQWLKSVAETEELRENDSIELSEVPYDQTFFPHETTIKGINIIRNYDENTYRSVLNYYFFKSAQFPEEDWSFLSGVLPEIVNRDFCFRNASFFGYSDEEFEKISGYFQNLAVQTATPSQLHSTFKPFTKNDRVKTDSEQMIFHSVAEYNGYKNIGVKSKSNRRTVHNNQTARSNNKQYHQINNNYDDSMRGVAGKVIAWLNRQDKNNNTTTEFTSDPPIDSK